MTDCHVGQNCCIGFTAITTAYQIVSSYIGGDIGCGILIYPLPTGKRLNLKKIEKTIKKIIPMGNGHEHIHCLAPVAESYIVRYIMKAQQDADHFSSMHNLPAVQLSFQYFVQLCQRIGVDEFHCIRSFGTLGGGNHFIEINLDESNETHYLTIHSGSRTFGMKLFEYHNRKIPTGSKVLTGLDAIQYCFDMILAQQLAKMNRHIMLQLILREFGWDFEEDRMVESIHNYIDFRQMVLRKGAISAQTDELCVVALNMKDGVLLCRGKGNEEWNWSCAHGCGRILSRHDARRSIKLSDYKSIMKDVVTTSVCIETIDEAPQAYKDMNIIMEALLPTVTIVKQLKSVVNLKGVD